MIFVESIDRLSRQKLLKTKSLIYDKILSKGVKIITTSDGAIYQDHEDPNEVFKQDLMISLIAQRSNEESRIKSVRRKSAWYKAKSDITRPFNAHNPPYGIIYNNDKNCFEIDTDKQKELVELFTLLRDFGIKETVKRLSENKNYRVWNNKLITNLFEYRYVLGLYKSQKRENGKKVFVEFIENYYPQLVSNLLFDQAKAAMTERRTKRLFGGREKYSVNVFRHCLKCDYCGETLILEKQINPQKKTYYYVQCAKNRNISKSCPQPRIRFDWIVSVVMRQVAYAHSVAVFGEVNDNLPQGLSEHIHKTNELFLGLLSKEKISKINKETEVLKEELSKKQARYDILKNQLEAFLTLDNDNLHIDPLLAQKLSLMSKEIADIKLNLDKLFLQEKEENAKLGDDSIFDFAELLKTEKGRIQINNYLIKNDIQLRVVASKTDENDDSVRVDFYKENIFYMSYNSEFTRKKPIFGFSGHYDLTELMTEI